MNNLKLLYSDLVSYVGKKQSGFVENDLSVFSASAGSEYNGKLMIVGRAVNGWNHYLNPSSEDSVTRCIDSLHYALETESLSWVKSQWGCRDNYNTKKSAFWRLAKAISSTVNLTSDFHTDLIVWTNLYKVAKAYRGNPSGRLMNIQFNLCKRILDSEIEYYKPQYIVFLTGLDWAKPFLTGSTKAVSITSLSYVKQVGFYQGARYIVAQHPQGKNEKLHLNEIVFHIN